MEAVKTKYNKYTDESFKSIKDFENFYRSGKSLKYDYVIVGGLLFTMHEYDMDGKYVTWANKKHNKMIEVKTSSRYKTGYIDAEMEEYEPSYLREDITYAE